MSRPEPLAANARAFAALGDVTRLHLLSRLGDGRSHSITELGGGLRLTRQGVTKHLRVLEDVGLVRSVRAGRENRFTGVPTRINELHAYLGRVSTQWDEALVRLRSFVER